MADNPQELDPSTPTGVAALSETVSYYLNLRLSAKDQHVQVTVPPAVHQIVELALGLPRPDVHAWAALAVGKMPKEAKAKAAKATDAGDGEAKPRSRGKWSEDNKAELVRMVEEEAFRTEQLGADGTHAGHVNWSALARRYGFSGTAPIHRMYTQMTGKDPPGVKAKAPRAEGDTADEPASKKAKPAAPAAPKPAAAKPAAKPGADGWSQDEVDELIKLVENEAHRKAQTGKRHLKWSRIGDVLKKGKKECKKKYTAVTGKTPADD